MLKFKDKTPWYKSDVEWNEDHYSGFILLLIVTPPVAIFIIYLGCRLLWP